MVETPLEASISILEEERKTLVISAQLVHTRLGKLIERGEPGLGFELVNIASLLARLRDSIEDYKRAKAVHLALAQAAGTVPADQEAPDAED